MTSRRGRHQIAAAICAVAAGCSQGSPAKPTPLTAVDAGPTVSGTKLAFLVDPGTACAGGAGICVAPSQIVTFGVSGSSGTAVTLSLQGGYGDAALTAQDVVLTGGTTSVMLESASTTAAFDVVARLVGAAADQTLSLHVTVSPSGTASIEATPVYAGRRAATSFYVTDFVLSTCSDLILNPPDAGSVTWAEGGADAAIPLVVPAGERVAVDVRIGHYAYGCTDVDPLVPEAGTAIEVPVYDVPMALSLTNLQATFSYTLDGNAASSWEATMQAAVARIESAFFGTTEAEGSALLDAMRAVLPTAANQSQFDTLRASGGWNAKAAAWMSAHTPSIAARAATWLGQAQTANVGPFVLAIGPEPSGSSTAQVTAVSFGPLSAMSAGIAQPMPFEWSAYANDTVSLSGAFDLAATPFVAALADAQASAAVAGAVDVPSAIAVGINCGGFATAVVGAGVSYGTCDATCTAGLCRNGLAQAWGTASTASAGGGDVVHTAIAATAPADVGDLAEPAYVSGQWLGQVSGPGVPASALPASGTQSFPISGTLVATEPSP
jgi:hypothetical protein